LSAGRLYQILAYCDKSPLKGAWSESSEPVFKICPNHIFVIGEARHLKFRVLIDTEEYVCMHDILLPPKGMCLESHDLYKSGEMSDNILESVQASLVA